MKKEGNVAVCDSIGDIKGAVCDSIGAPLKESAAVCVSIGGWALAVCDSIGKRQKMQLFFMNTTFYFLFNKNMSVCVKKILHFDIILNFNQQSY